MEQLHEANHHLRYVALVAIWLLHVETLSKAEISENVKYQVGDLVFHVDRLGQFIALVLLLLSEQFEPSVGVLVDESLSTTQGALGEGVIHDATFASMLGNICGTPSVHSFDSSWPDLVIIGLLDVALGAKDGLVCIGSVDADAVGRVAEFSSCHIISKP